LDYTLHWDEDNDGEADLTYIYAYIDEDHLSTYNFIDADGNGLIYEYDWSDDMSVLDGLVYHVIEDGVETYYWDIKYTYEYDTEWDEHFLVSSLWEAISYAAVIAVIEDDVAWECPSS
ncbi:MAG: hypothetical protein ACI8PZ_007416, partial [Myxococcota bacterium]